MVKMAKWKGKKVSSKKLHDLKANAEYRRICERSKYGFNYQAPPFVIGGKKNSKVNGINAY
jgi:hypothetical protein